LNEWNGGVGVTYLTAIDFQRTFACTTSREAWAAGVCVSSALQEFLKKKKNKNKKKPARAILPGIRPTGLPARPRAHSRLATPKINNAQTHSVAQCGTVANLSW
jgi:hypothetical protein